MSRNLYNNNEMWDSDVEESLYKFLFSLFALLIIGFLVIPYWTSYGIGRGTWARRRMLTKIGSGFVLGAWVILWIIAAVNARIDRVFIESLFARLLILAFGLGSVALAYYIGKAMRKS